MARVRGMAEAVRDWVARYDGAPSPVRLNVTVDDREGASVLTGTASVLSEYIGGVSDRRMTFTCALVTRWSDGADATNPGASEDAEAWLDWVADRARAGDWPKAPEGIRILGVETDEDAPRLAMVYPDGRMARYEFTAHVDFRS